MGGGGGQNFSFPTLFDSYRELFLISGVISVENGKLSSVCLELRRVIFERSRGGTYSGLQSAEFAECLSCPCRACLDL